MKIRTQIAIAFLFLAILPMTAIVLYSYVSSLSAVREAVEAEAESLTSDMENRMTQVRGDLRRRVERISALPFRRWAFEAETEKEREELYGSMMAELGETAPLVTSFEFVPEYPGTAEDAVPSPDVETASELIPAPPRRPPPPPAPIVIDMREMLKTVEAGIENLDAELIPDTDREELIEQAKLGLEFVQEKAEVFNLHAGRLIEIRAETEELHRLTETAPTAEAEEDTYRMIFSPEVEVPVYEDGEMVGEIRARVANEKLLERVLHRTLRERGEVPFAVDTEGNLFAASDEDRGTLLGLGLQEPVDAERITDQEVFGDWIVATSADQATGLTFGIARPIRDSITEMRSTALRNFGFGTGLIGLALLGVLPLSRRITHGLKLVAESAERVAGGDLEARVPLQSRSEIGQLAKAFNNMAQDLEENQQRLIESERLQVEFDRKTEELEEARRFQLSLLPKRLPDHPSFDLAAMMRTATEVGGDYYDFRVADDGTLTVAIGDATGHGAKAGTMVTVVKSLFSAYPPGGDLAEFQKKGADAIKRMALGRMSMALTLARLTKGRLTLCAAGMPPALLHRAATGKVEEIAIEGMPLGGLDFTYRQVSVSIDAGDTLLLMSDGFPELPDRDGNTLGYERAAELFAATAGSKPNEVIEHLLARARDWAGDSAPADDVTFVVARVR
ncbi:MAG: SpoIIE family protein phosphatase [bacterium]|nr:SpoIIE family protein phosphatase [bacterium]